MALNVRGFCNLAKDESKETAAKAKVKKDARVYQQAKETKENSKEAAPAKVKDENDARLSETKKKNAVKDYVYPNRNEKG